jgi:hypothetical protein
VQEELKPLWSNLQVQTAGDLFSVIRFILAKRIQLELGDCIISADSDKVLSAFEQKHLQYLLNNNEVGLDKRGLCYTLNYFARACRLISNENDAYSYAKLSYQFNMQVGDKTGACIAAGTAGFASAGLGTLEDAYNWFRISFGIGWSIQHFSRFNIVMNMLLMAKSIGDDCKEKEVKFYARQLELLSVIPFMGRQTISNDLALELLTNKHELENLAEQRMLSGPICELGNNPIDFLSSLHEVIAKNDFLDKQFIVTSTPTSLGMSASILNKTVSIQHQAKKETLVIYTSCIQEVDEWFISHIEITNPNPL